MAKSNSLKQIVVGRRFDQYFPYIFITLLSIISFVPVFADVSYTIGSSLNKTVVVSWTFEDAGLDHVLKCIAEGSPLPSLKWIRDDDLNFTSSEGIIVDVSKPEAISISFNPITYNIMGDYICVSSVPGKEEYTDFRVFVETPKSTALVIWALLLLIIFLASSVFICKTLRINHTAVEMEK